ncbi:hypothetical protein V1507DRAFT_338312 [Lipomyces tetrasporus]
MQVVVVFLLFFNPCRGRNEGFIGSFLYRSSSSHLNIQLSLRRPDHYFWELDLAFYASVKAFAECVSKLPRIDVFLENAGIAKVNFSLADGHERTITVNVISISMLGLLLLPKLKVTANEIPTSKPHWTS